MCVCLEAHVHGANPTAHVSQFCILVRELGLQFNNSVSEFMQLLDFSWCNLPQPTPHKKKQAPPLANSGRDGPLMAFHTYSLCMPNQSFLGRMIQGGMHTILEQSWHGHNFNREALIRDG